jgi:hypothetical protein
MSYDTVIDTMELVALLGVMAVLCYLVYLLRLELSGATAALRAIVLAQKDLDARLKVLERERER